MNKEHKLSRNALLNLIYNIIGMIFPLVVATHASRVLLPEGIGLTSYITNIAGYFVAIAPMGITTYGIKAIAQCRDSRERNKVFSELLVLNAASTTFVCIAYFLMIFLIPYFKENLVLYIIAGMTIIANFINVEWLYRGMENYKYITIRNIIVKFLSAIVIFLFVNTKRDIYIYMLIICGMSSCNNLFNIVHARKYVKLSVPIDIHHMISYLKPLFVLSISLVAGEIYLKMDITMLGTLTNNENVGYYSSALKIINMVLIAITSLTAVSLPQLAERYVYENKEMFRQFVVKLLKPIVIFSTAASIGISLVSKDLVIIFFGDAFERSSSVIVILSLLFIIKGIGDLLCYQVVIATANEKILPGIRVISVLMNFVLNFILIKVFQYNGAAMATVITEFFTLISVMFLMRKKIQIKIEKAFILSILISNMFMVVVIKIVQRVIINEIFRLFFSILFGIIIYFISLIVCKKIVHNKF